MSSDKTKLLSKNKLNLPWYKKLYYKIFKKNYKEI